MQLTNELQSALVRTVDSRYWNLIILPTEKCNFRCTYCYESFEHGAMRPEVVGAVKKLIARRLPELSHFTINWFGGEPLLARNVVLEICKSVQDAMGPGLHFSSSMTTNGYLLDETCFEELISLGVTRFQITLDGWGDGHDKTRRQAGGGNTFDCIWENLKLARCSRFDFRIILRVHFNPSNIDSVRQLLNEISSEFGSDDRFCVFLKAVGRYGGPNDGATSVYGPEEQRAIRRQLASLVRMSVPATHVGDLGGYICYASKPNSLVIRSTGALAKCTVALEHPSNDVGRLRPDGTLQFEQNQLSRWFVGLKTLDQSHLSCPWGHIRRNTLIPLGRC